MLYLVGLGLNYEKDVSVKGMEVIKKAKAVYLEDYTSRMQVDKEKLEKFYGKRIQKANREFVEKKIRIILEEAKKEDVAFLVQGDVHSATTHIDLFLRAKKENVPVKVIFGVSILTAVGVTGLSLYNFGKTISIPFHHENVTSSYENFLINKKNGMHTLVLLDLNPEDEMFLTIKEGLGYFKRQGLDEDTLVVGCARIGSDDQIIRFGELRKIREIDFGKPPFCIVIPGKLQFYEEEALESWK
mgnify:FL=1